MKIPQDYAKRLDFFFETLRKCLVSRDQRRDQCKMLRSYYLYGCGVTDDPNSTYNKIYAHIDQLTSLMFSAETTRFYVSPSITESDIELHKSPVMSQALLEDWHETNGDVIFGLALKWAFVHNSSFIKSRWADGELQQFPVYQYDVGVLREDVQGLDRQEAVVHCYYISKHQLENELKEHPRKYDILKRVSAAPRPRDESIGGMEKIALSTTTPTVMGNLDIQTVLNNQYTASVAEDLVQMFELYVWDDEKHDYNVLTFAEPNIIIWDRQMEDMWIKAELPLVQICPNPDPTYFFGISEVERLVPLQRLRNERMDQVRHLCNLQAHPPKILMGFPGAVDEMALALDTQQGILNAEFPSANAKSMAPEIPEDIYREIREIDQMFEDVSGISGVLKGQGEAGVRSNAHAKNLANFGSSRARQKALLVEDSLEKIATMMVRAKMRYDADSEYRSSDGTKFKPFQFTDHFIAKIDAHSSSPIFVEDLRQLAIQMLQLKMITREDAITMMDAPMPQLLKMKLRTIIEPAEQQQAQQQAQAEQAKHGAKPKLVKK